MLASLLQHSKLSACPETRLSSSQHARLTRMCLAGGRVRVRVSSKDIHKAFPETKIVVRAMNLHAPLIDRLLEIPMDIHEGAF